MVSRERRGDAAEGHSLASLCAALLGKLLDKGEQASDWTRRPLSERQLRYAAVDPEILLDLRCALRGEPTLER